MSNVPPTNPSYLSQPNGGNYTQQTGPAPGSANNARATITAGNYPGGTNDDYNTNVIVVRGGSFAKTGKNDKHGVPNIVQTDTTATVATEMQVFFKMGKSELTQLQQQLIAAGFLSDGDQTPGQPDEHTAAAFHTMLLRAANSGRTSDEVLAASAAAGGAGAGTKGKPFSPVLANPTDIKAVLDQQVPQILGHALTDAETNKLVGVYQQLQTSAQKSAYDTNISGGASTAAPAIDAFAQEQAQQLHPQDAVNYGNLLQARTFMNMIGNFPGSQG